MGILGKLAKTIYGTKRQAPAPASGQVAIAQMHDYVSKTMRTSLGQFIGQANTDDLKQQIKYAVMNKMHALQSQGILHNWVVKDVVIKDGVADIQCDIQSAPTPGVTAMSADNFHSHDWKYLDPLTESIVPDHRCKNCGMSVTILDNELPLVSTRDDLNCNEYAIKDVVQ